jgi:hypothetical protein
MGDLDAQRLGRKVCRPHGGGATLGKIIRVLCHAQQR